MFTIFRVMLRRVSEMVERVPAFVFSGPDVSSVMGRNAVFPARFASVMREFISAVPPLEMLVLGLVLLAAILPQP